MHRTFARVVLGAALVLAAAQHSVVAEQDWAYPPDISLEELRERVTRVSPAHPRLLVQPGELERLREFASEDPVRKALADAIVRQANRIRNERPITYTKDGRRLLRQSRTCVQRVLTLATAYHLTGDERFAQRCQREMVAAARFDDWNPDHFLDVAEMTFALAIGYDWLYNQLEPDAREQIRGAIVTKGVALAFDSPYTGWTRAADNWGQVCHAGLTLGALAVLEDEPDLAARTVDNALRNVTEAMAVYAPSGGHPEGPTYWTYGTTFNILLIAALESALGTDFGLSRAPGFEKTGEFISLVTGPSGLLFNFSDGRREDRSGQVGLFWLASRYGRPDWLLGEGERLLQVAGQFGRDDEQPGRGRLLPLGLFWWRPPSPDVDIRMPLHASTEGNTPIAIHRSSWSDPHATFVAVKGGSPAESHGQMDIGSFVLDAGGVRWAVDLGSEEYGPLEARGLGIWNFGQDSDRWKVFRQSSLSHNTLVINDQLQHVNGRSRVVSFSDDPAFPHSILDMSPAYDGLARSVKRGVALLPSGDVIIQDELSGLVPGSRVRWGMATTARAEGTDARSIVLREGDQRLTLTRLTGDSLGWETIDISKRVNDWDSPNPGTRMVAFTTVAPESGELTIAVLARREGDSTAEEVTVRALDLWRENKTP